MLNYYKSISPDGSRYVIRAISSIALAQKDENPITIESEQETFLSYLYDKEAMEIKIMECLISHQEEIVKIRIFPNIYKETTISLEWKDLSRPIETDNHQSYLQMKKNR